MHERLRQSPTLSIHVPFQREFLNEFAARLHHVAGSAGDANYCLSLAGVGPPLSNVGAS